MKKKIVWACVIIMIAMCFFPPWERSERGGFEMGDPHYVWPVGHHCIFLPQGEGMTIDVTRLMHQCVIVTLLTGGIFLAVGKSKKD